MEHISLPWKEKKWCKNKEEFRYWEYYYLTYMLPDSFEKINRWNGSAYASWKWTSMMSFQYCFMHIYEKGNVSLEFKLLFSQIYFWKELESSSGRFSSMT